MFPHIDPAGPQKKLFKLFSSSSISTAFFSLSQRYLLLRLINKLELQVTTQKQQTKLSCAVVVPV
jgi:hypothetical protein